MVKGEHCKAPCIWKGGTHMPAHGCIVGYVPITNADSIRAMTDEELAKFIENPSGKPWYRCSECKWESCKECCLEWLRQENETN